MIFGTIEPSFFIGTLLLSQHMYLFSLTLQVISKHLYQQRTLQKRLAQHTTLQRLLISPSGWI